MKREREIIKNEERPLHERVREQLRERCLAQGPDTALPPVRELRELLGVKQNTVTRAIRDLETSGLIRIVPRKGVFVIGGTEATVELLFINHEEGWRSVPQRFLNGMQQALQPNERVTGTTLVAPPYPDAEMYSHQLQLRSTRAVAVTNYDYRAYPDSLHETKFIYDLAARLPVVLLGKPHRFLELDCVYCDTRPQLRAWLQECYERGVRRFGYLSNVTETAQYTMHYRERVGEFREFLLDYGLQLSANSDLTVPHLRQGGVTELEKVVRLLEADPPVEAVFASSPEIATTLVLEAYRHGRVPGRDLHVLCIADAISEVEAIRPYSTTILLQDETVGREAWRFIEERLQGRGPSEPHVHRVPATLLPPDLGVLSAHVMETDRYTNGHSNKQVNGNRHNESHTSQDVGANLVSPSAHYDLGETSLTTTNVVVKSKVAGRKN